MKPNQSIAFTGKIGAIVHTTQPDGRVFEQYQRPPGTRLIIVSPDGKILITREHRHEAGGVDLRLPGGKVCDSFADYQKLLESGQDIVAAATAGAIKEAIEETGLIIHDPELIAIAKAGATVDWDLYYFLVRNYDQHEDGQQLEHGENIEVMWLSIAEIKAAIAADHMGEWRSVGVLLGKVLPLLEAAK